MVSQDDWLEYNSETKLNSFFFIGLKEELLLVFDLHTFISTVNNWNIQETSRVH